MFTFDKGTISHLLSSHWLMKAPSGVKNLPIDQFKFLNLVFNLFASWTSTKFFLFPYVGLIPKNVTRNTEYNMD